MARLSRCAAWKGLLHCTRCQLEGGVETEVEFARPSVWGGAAAEVLSSVRLLALDPLQIQQGMQRHFSPDAYAYAGYPGALPPD